MRMFPAYWPSVELRGNRTDVDGDAHLVAIQVGTDAIVEAANFPRVHTSKGVVALAEKIEGEVKELRMLADPGVDEPGHEAILDISPSPLALEPGAADDAPIENFRYDDDDGPGIVVPGPSRRLEFRVLVNARFVVTSPIEDIGAAHPSRKANYGPVIGNKYKARHAEGAMVH